MTNKRLTPEFMAPFELQADPYPDLPVLAPEKLQDGDVLMMLGEGWVDIGPIRLPVSWLIRVLDGGAYSHSAMVSIINCEPHVWDHSDHWELSPVALKKGIKNHKWCHVYRLNKHGEQVGSNRYPPAPIVKILNEHRGNPYDKVLLLMAGVVAVISRMPENPELREAVRVGLDALVIAVNWLLDQRDVRSGMLICTAVAGMSYWNAINEVAHDYALEVDIQRSRQGARDSGGDEDWERTIVKLEHVLARIWPDFHGELKQLEQTLACNSRWVDVGGALLPVNLVSPSDLEYSRTLTRIGRLEIPK